MIVRKAGKAEEGVRGIRMLAIAAKRTSIVTTAGTIVGKEAEADNEVMLMRRTVAAISAPAVAGVTAP